MGQCLKQTPLNSGKTRYNTNVAARHASTEPTVIGRENGSSGREGACTNIPNVSRPSPPVCNPYVKVRKSDKKNSRKSKIKSKKKKKKNKKNPQKKKKKKKKKS